MGRGTQSGSAAIAQARAKTEPKLRVLVASPNAIASAGIATLLRSHSEFEVASTLGGNAEIQELLSQTDADVLILELDQNSNGAAFEHVIPDAFAIIGLINNPSSTFLKRMVASGIQSLLPLELSAEELAQAVRATAAGLAVLSPEFAALLSTDASDPIPPELDPMQEPLTPREQDVLSMMAEGLLNKEIADRLRISEHTVKFHVSSIMGKLDASSRTEAVMRGIRRGIVIV